MNEVQLQTLAAKYRGRNHPNPEAAARDMLAAKPAELSPAEWYACVIKQADLLRDPGPPEPLP